MSLFRALGEMALGISAAHSFSRRSLWWAFHELAFGVFAWCRHYSDWRKREKAGDNQRSNDLLHKSTPIGSARLRKADGRDHNKCDTLVK